MVLTATPKLVKKSVPQYWRDFTAGWRRDTSTISSTTTLSVTNVGTLWLSLSLLLQALKLILVQFIKEPLRIAVLAMVHQLLNYRFNY